MIDRKQQRSGPSAAGFIAALALIALAFFESAPAHADDWSVADKERQAVYTALHLADYAQTHYIARHPDAFRENNPLLGAHPSVGQVNTYFAITLAGHYIIADQLSPKWRARWQYAWIAAEALQVVRNRSIGVGFNF